MKTATGAAAVIDGMMEATKTHHGTLTAEEGAGLQQDQQAAVALREKLKTAETAPQPRKQLDDDMESTLLKQSQLEG